MLHPARPRPLRAPLLWLLLPFAAGIAAADMVGPPLPAFRLTGLIVAVGAIAVGSLAHSPRLWRISLLGTLFFTGWLHYQISRAQLPSWQTLPDREITFAVSIDRVLGDPASVPHLGFIGTLRDVDHPAADLRDQRVHVQLRRATAPPADLVRGATLQLVGRITVLPAHSPDGFVQYLEDSGMNFRIRQARWRATLDPPSAYARGRDALRQRAGAILSAGLHHRPDLATALRAMLLGERHALSPAAKEQFLRSGTMHLFAISGLHIGVIAGTLYAGLRILRLSPQANFLLGTLLLWGYVDLIGQTPSAVRAWLMITCFHAARIWRAPGNSVAAIATSALLVLLGDPRQLFAAGFQMSYAIVFALLIHGIPLGEHWQRLLRPWADLPPSSLSRHQRRIQHLIDGLAVAAAFTWTAGLIGLLTSVAFFGWFTPLAFYANVLLVPLASGVVAAGFGAVLLGLCGALPLALVFNHAAALLLLIMQTGLQLGLGHTGSLPATFRLPGWGQVGMIIVLATMVATREPFGAHLRWRWWAPTIASLVMLVIGLQIT